MSRLIIDEVIYDWNDALGDTISEKYEALYVFIVDQMKKLPQDKGPLTIQCADTICSILDTTAVGLSSNIAPFYVNGVLKYMGSINNKWDVWLDSFMSYEEMWLYNDDGMVKVLISNLDV